MWGGGWLSWGFWPWGLDNAWWGGVFVWGGHLNHAVEMASGVRCIPDTVLAVGEMGLNWRFGVRVGWPRRCWCAGARG